MTVDLANLKGVKVERKKVYGTIELATLHVYEWQPGTHTYCGKDCGSLLELGEHYVADMDLFGVGPLRGDEVMCPECAATTLYKEQLAWYTLGELP